MIVLSVICASASVAFVAIVGAYAHQKRYIETGIYYHWFWPNKEVKPRHQESQQ